MLGREPTRSGGVLLDLERAARELLELSQRFGLFYQGCDVLILDEPTAVLTPGEVRDLFEVLRAPRPRGGTVCCDR